MKNNRYFLPSGVKDYLPNEWSEKNEIEKQIKYQFESYGYACVQTPTYEYLEVFEGNGSTSRKQMVKFIDSQGDVIVLRPDMTPAIARIVSMYYSEQDLPLRLCYIENTFRNNETFQGKLKEKTQAGIELIGASCVESDVEVVMLAIQCLKRVGLVNFCIDIGHSDFLPTFLSDHIEQPELITAILEEIVKRDFVALDQLLANSNVSQLVIDFLNYLPNAVGDLEVINKLRLVVKNARALESLNRLQQVYQLVESFGHAEYIRFDMSMIGDFRYYTGIIFRGYTAGTGFWVLDGGRYDRLLQNNQVDCPSIGFGIRIDDVLMALNQQNICIVPKKKTALIGYALGLEKESFLLASQLRNHDICIYNSLEPSDINKNLILMKKNSLDRFFYIEDEKQSRIYTSLTESYKMVSTTEISTEWRGD